MKFTTCLLAMTALCAPLFADETFDEFSFPETFPCANGNILFTNVGNYSVTPGKWIRLSTNSTYTVVCQIAYENTTFANGPSTPEEIKQARQAESCLNLGLLKFLQKTCEGKSDAELVRDYRSGKIRAKVEDIFPNWFDGYVDPVLKARYGSTPIDGITIYKISMRAVGPFAEALDAL